MTGYLLDTSFVVAYFNELATRRVGPARRCREALPPDGRLYVSIVTLAEVLEGAADPRAVELELRRLARAIPLPAGLAAPKPLVKKMGSEISPGAKAGDFSPFF